MNDIYSRHQQKARQLIEWQRFKEAEVELRAALAIYPDDGATHAVLADCILRQNNPARYKEAQQEAHLGVMHDPENASTYHVLGECLCVLGQLAAAEKVVRKAVEISPEYAGYHVYLGVLLLDLCRINEAKKELQAALALDPENHWALYYSMVIESWQGNTDQAAKHTRQMLQVAPDKAESHIALGRLLMQTGIDKSAEDAFREALRIDPNNKDAYVDLLKMQRGGMSRRLWFLPECVHALLRFRWVLFLMMIVALSTAMRSCHQMDPKPEKSTIRYALPDGEHGKMTQDELMEYIKQNVRKKP